MTRHFVDTNVLLYATSRDPGDEAKRVRAQEILETTECALSVQVLGEFFVQATHEKRARPYTRAEATTMVRALLEFPIAPVTPDVVTAAIGTCRRFQISYWDGAILEAARSLRCDTVLTEDLAHGQDYDGVRVENPFV